VVALQSNTTGGANTAMGHSALRSNTTGEQNTANGFQALYSNTDGLGNTAAGYQALYSSNGDNNTATGIQALVSNTSDDNTANGAYALYSNTTGNNNTATGRNALVGNTTGNNNTAIGSFALRNSNGNRNTAIGQATLLFNSGDLNIALGDEAGRNLTTGSNNIDIGNAGVAAEARTIRIGTTGTQTKTFVAGVNGAAVTGSAVKVNAAGQLGTAPSSQRFKDAIKPMDKASEAILALKPVTFHYKKEIDPEGIPEFGLIAEQVEKVNPDLVARDGEGKIYTVRYEAVNAMLLNEFLKEHRKVEEQQATITRLESKVAKQELTATRQQKQIEALTATVQKVSDQVALSKPAPQLVANP